jgi:transcriptional regulator GlxA family with amidase domain
MPANRHDRRVTPAPRSRDPRRIAIVAFPDVQVLDVTGPHEVFSLAHRFRPEGDPGYAVELLAAVAGPLRASSGLGLMADRPLGPPADKANSVIDTVVVAGGNGTAAAAADDRLTGWLVAVEPGCRRLASVCSGAFVLAAAGLLDGKRATTHWSECDTLARYYPSIEVHADPIFVRDGKIATSAGVTAGMDLALALVEEDMGRDTALHVARWLVMFVQRSGGQSQFSSQLAGQLAERAPLRELQTWMADHPGADLSVPALATRVAMSDRNFARVFRREVGTTPAAYVEQVRCESARRLLETTDRTVDDIARVNGFGTTETLQRTFQRIVGVSPRLYRRHFQAPADSRRLETADAAR